jgi:ribulose-phosphate 3-epimerase
VNCPLVAPSVLSADFSRLGEAVRLIETSGGDWVHLDVMDGNFVPQITFGSKVVADLRPVAALPFDVHLMVETPERHVLSFSAAGADLITVHAETTRHLHRLLHEIRQAGAKPGVSIVPSTPVAAIQEILGMVDLVLVMTVNPGYGGQDLILDTLRKVEALSGIREKLGLSFYLEVDGGINQSTAGSAVQAGADVLVTGSSFFHSSSPAEYVTALKKTDNAAGQIAARED